MKKIITILTLFAYFGGFAQKEVSKKVNELLSQNVIFKPYSVLTATSNSDRDVNEVVDHSTLATIKMQAVQTLVADKNEYIELSIPYQGNTIAMQLYKVDIFAEGFHADTDKQKSISYQKGIYYRGIVKGDPNSVAAFSFFNNELNGMVSSDSYNNLVVGKLNRSGNINDYIIYSDMNMKVQNNFECHVKDAAILPAASNKNNTVLNPQSTRCVTMYFEIDYNLYQQNGSNTVTTNNWMTSVFNNVQTLYNNDGITVSLKSTFIWTSDDPYTGEDSSDYLFQFNDLRPVFDGDVGQLVGIDPG
ncbi:MAG TPA: M12 family metallo-peptidase, partial [Flavobacterium sp.]|nr:M12 family metallo-peptidase [Flavobacterium sp.]